MMAGHWMGILIYELAREKQMSNQFTAKVAMDQYNEQAGFMPFPKIQLEDTPLPGKVSDPVSQPVHYTGHKSGIECIQITEHMGFNIGNAVKYLWRCDLKNDAIEDLKKAAWYIAREISKREKAAA